MKNIEKVKNYNQRLLAVFGTVASLLVIGMLLLTFLEILVDSFPRRSQDNPSGILSEEQVDILRKDSLVKESISYEFPMLVDTLNSIYLIPVSPQTLQDATEYSGKRLNLTSRFSSKENYKNRYYGTQVNLLVYDAKNGATDKLFSNRVVINSFTWKRLKNDYFLIMDVAEKDTNKSGEINVRDLKVLYIYSFKNKDIKRVEERNATIMDYDFVPDSYDLILRFGMDKDNNGSFDYYNEPSIIKTYNIESGELNSIVSSELDVELLRIITGMGL